MAQSQKKRADLEAEIKFLESALESCSEDSAWYERIVARIEWVRAKLKEPNEV